MRCVGTVTLLSGTITGTTGQLTSANFNVTNATGTTNIAAILAGSGQLTKTGAGSLTMTGANTYTGITTINAGTVVITHNTGLGSTAGGTLVASGAILDLQNVAVGAEEITLAGGTLTDVKSSLAGNIILTANSNLGATNVGDTFTLSGVISGGFGITKIGAGTVILSGVNTYTGATNINAGILSVTGSLADATAVTVANDATYNLAASDTIASLTGAGNVTLNSNTLTVAGSTDTTFSCVMSGTGGLVKDGTANFTMSGANTYNGGTTINAGTLTLGANNVLADTGEVNVSGGTLNIATFNDTVGTVTLSSGTITGSTGQLSSANFNVTNATGTTNIAAILAGSGQLTKTGAGVVTLSRANTYTGDTNINAGTLILTGSLASATDVVMTNTAIWDLQAAQTVASLTMATGNSITNTTGTSSLVVNGLSTLANSITTTGIQTYTGAVTLAANTAINTTDSAVTFSAGIAGIGITLTVNAGNGAINTAALGTSAASLGAVILNSTGATTLGGATYAASITTNAGGTVAINTGTVTTSGAQTYNDDLELFRTTVLQSIEDSVIFNKTISAPGNNKNGADLIIFAKSDVAINGNIGSNFLNNTLFRELKSNINNLTITAGRILINADVLTMVEQTYNGSVIVGNNGANGTTRTLLSLDPKIHFNGTVDDQIANTHTDCSCCFCEPIPMEYSRRAAYYLWWQGWLRKSAFCSLRNYRSSV